jgi:hypothetical protein
MAGRRMLIVLDYARDAAQVVPVLSGSPTCTVIVTSRDRLGSLVTAHGAHPISVGMLDEPAARAVLARRIDARRLAAEPEAVDVLVDGCAGSPLALSILAGRAVLYPRIPLQDLAAELRNATTKLDALDVGDPTASLRTVLSWSYTALTPEPARVFGLLGLAPRPDITFAAAVDLTGLPESRLGEVLRMLERVSLVQQQSPAATGCMTWSTFTPQTGPARTSPWTTGKPRYGGWSTSTFTPRPAPICCSTRTANRSTSAHPLTTAIPM